MQSANNPSIENLDFEQFLIDPHRQSNPVTALAQVNEYFKSRSLDDFLRWAYETFGASIAQVTSFGPSGLVILDYLHRLELPMRIITIDTNFLFEETYAQWQAIEKRYNLKIEVKSSPMTPEEQAQQYQPHLWREHPNQCCKLRKVQPLQETLDSLEAWITGLRQDQSFTRAQIPLVQWDEKYNLVKLNPVARWTRGEVWTYLLRHNLPYNELHNWGYASIGCMQCTIPAMDPEDERSGRWFGSAKTECGMHFSKSS